MGYRVQFTIDIMKNSEPKVFYDHKTAIFSPPIIPIFRAYDEYEVKKEVTAKRSKKERKETCLLPLDIEDLSDCDSTVTSESG